MTRARRRHRVAVITGTRAEYGALQSIIEAIDAEPRLDLRIVACGMHLLPRFGSTINDIRRDGWPIAARVRMQRGDDSPGDQAAGLARGVDGIARFLLRDKTDIVVVLGDRIEAMAGALAGATTGALIAHIHGGDVAPGDFDDSLRHAITRLAHIHFAATPIAARRLHHMGEAAERIHVVGAPGLDHLIQLRGAWRSKPELPAEVSDLGPYALIVQHAHGRSAAVERRVARMICDEVARAGLARVIIYPNTDRGGSGVIAAIEAHAKRRPRDTRVFKSLPRDAFLRALFGARALVGNSSSGIIEAPAARTPSVNVGDRQKGRDVGGKSVINATESAASVRAALRKAVAMRPRAASQIYGNGRAGERIARKLATIAITPELLRKHFNI
ncbi:MAG: UDP-N-acetylglucosamine 2-epimerase (hydrolyzing) [Phycisphaerales bacterium]|nr:UDP-N-acetylglucosamine 2-epimerase (hydrolyzing) [Phycisphaerales bacterium]